MGYSAVPGSPGTAFASGHPATGGNLGVIRTDDAGQTWALVSKGPNGPVDFYNTEVSRADPAVIHGFGHDRVVQRSTDVGVTVEASGLDPETLIDFATSPTDAALPFAATEAGLISSLDQGATWTALIGEVQVSAVDVGANDVLRAVDLVQWLVAIDPAREITPLSSDLPDGYLLHLATTSVDPLRLSALSARGCLVGSAPG